MAANETSVGEQGGEVEELMDIKIGFIFAVFFCSLAGVTGPLCFKSRISPSMTYLLRAFASGDTTHA